MNRTFTVCLLTLMLVGFSLAGKSWESKVLKWNEAVAACSEDDSCIQKANQQIKRDVMKKQQQGELSVVEECEDGHLIAEFDHPEWGTIEAEFPCDEE